MNKHILYFLGVLLTISIFMDSIVEKLDGKGREANKVVENTENFKKKFKNAEMESMKSTLKRTAMKLNEKAPFAIDKLTTFLKQEVDGLTLISYFKLALDKNLIDIDTVEKFKEETIAKRCELAKFHDGYKGGVISVFDYKDINNKPLARIVINEQACSN